MFGISGEHIIILAIILIIFGPRKLPELGNTLGKALRNFKDSLAGIQEPEFRRIPEDAAKTAAAGADATHKKVITPTDTSETKTPSSSTPKNDEGQGSA